MLVVVSQKDFMSVFTVFIKFFWAIANQVMEKERIPFPKVFQNQSFEFFLRIAILKLSENLLGKIVSGVLF